MLYTYIHIYMYTCIHTLVYISLCMYIYIYIYTYVMIDNHIIIIIMIIIFSSAFLNVEHSNISCTPSPPTKSLGFEGFDSSRLFTLRGGNYHVL